MVVCEIDAEIFMNSNDMELRREYEERFGERFPSFNYADFPGDKDTPSAVEYLNLLKQALRDNKPYHIVSRRMF